MDDCCYNDFSESYSHSSAGDLSRYASTQHCLVEQPLEQPNIDLQVTLTQRWPGLNALLIDVAPYCLLVNECDLELTLVEENGGSWRLPAGKTFSPPFFNEVIFFINIVLPYCHMFKCHCGFVSELFLNVITINTTNFSFYVSGFVLPTPFSALTQLIGQQEGHLACKNVLCWFVGGDDLTAAFHFL